MNRKHLVIAGVSALILVGAGATAGLASAAGQPHQHQTIASQRSVKADLSASEAFFNIPSALTWDGRYLTTQDAAGHVGFRWDFVNLTNGPVYLANDAADGGGRRAMRSRRAFRVLPADGFD